MYKSINCAKPGCGSSMMLREHCGERKMICTKHKCRALTREFLSVYFSQHGATAVRCRLLPSVVVHMGVCCMCTSQAICIYIYIYMYMCVCVHVVYIRHIT